MSEDKYSVIMTAFDGNWEKLERAVPDVFGRKELNIHVTHPALMPAELVADVPKEEAERVASRLKGFQAEVCVIPTAEVEEGTYRAEDLWYSKVTENLSFSEVEGMILAEYFPMSIRSELRLMEQRGEPLVSWQYELYANHEHMDGFPDRETVRRSYAKLDILEDALTTAYPDRRFIIDLDPGDRISFCQAHDDAPREPSPCDRSPAKAWCSHCGTMQPYRKRAEPDAEFPEADWGDCAVCGNEVLVAAPEVLILVGPEPDAG